MYYWLINEELFRRMLHYTKIRLQYITINYNVVLIWPLFSSLNFTSDHCGASTFWEFVLCINSVSHHQSPQAAQALSSSLTLYPSAGAPTVCLIFKVTGECFASASVTIRPPSASALMAESSQQLGLHVSMWGWQPQPLRTPPHSIVVYFLYLRARSPVEGCLLFTGTSAKDSILCYG